MMRKLAYMIVLALVLAGCSTVRMGGMQPLDAEQKEAMLREVMNANFQAMIARDRGKMYDVYDPFFRIRVSKAEFERQAMPVYYHSYEISAIDIKGNVAKAETKIVYSISHLGVTGKQIKKDNTEGLVRDTWLFIDNKWHRQYYDNLTDGTFANY